MHVNNLGGARMPVTTTADRTTQTARTSFSTLVQGATSVPSTSPVGIPGSSIVAAAISASSGGIPGSGFGAPYLQTMPAGSPVPGRSGPISVHAQPSGGPNGLIGNPAAPVGSEFNGELMQMHQTQEELQMMMAIRELMKMSLMSFVQGTFAMGQNRPKPEAI